MGIAGKNLRPCIYFFVKISLPIFCSFCMCCSYSPFSCLFWSLVHMFSSWQRTPLRAKHHPGQSALNPSAGSRPPLCVLAQHHLSLHHTTRVACKRTSLCLPLRHAPGRGEGNLALDVRESEGTLWFAKHFETAQGFSNHRINYTERVPSVRLLITADIIN